MGRNSQDCSRRGYLLARPPAHDQKDNHDSNNHDNPHSDNDPDENYRRQKRIEQRALLNLL
jgi:hypothetical protein